MYAPESFAELPLRRSSAAMMRAYAGSCQRDDPVARCGCVSSTAIIGADTDAEFDEVRMPRSPDPPLSRDANRCSDCGRMSADARVTLS